MVLEEGYVYHIKNEFFEFVNDDKLMVNHEGNATRPNYFCIKGDEDGLMWFIPMSSRVEKYKKIMNNKIDKYKRCDTIIIGEYRRKEQAFLLQNMFPITQKYVDHIDTVGGKAQKVQTKVRDQILEKVDRIFSLKQKGINLIFPNVDRIARLLLEENKN